MKTKNLIAVFAIAPLLLACVSTETVRFQAKSNQQALIRDGRQAIVSNRKNSIVLVSPASREFQSGARPVFVVGINNLTKNPLEFAVSNISVHQKAADGRVLALPVKTYESLVAEERNKQVARAILVGLAAGANAAAASQAGYGTARANVYSTTHTPYGSYNRVSTVTSSYFDPTANAIAQANASAQNEAMIASTIEQGRQNLSSLEQAVIKDNTLLPGEWYGGQLHFEPPQSDGSDAPKTYRINIVVGSEVHEVEVVQEAVKS
ncbi:hypothetical protein [Microvirga alba]|uniref:Lipoprotein n=1 Tax=Microvirga alba TaxID=2791025 RepID=A0A931BT13_9HYPH|nr:hypothetical protein [Microvirga alba]MBF9233275.1 hypothetical protein [Microvirga alba]